MKKSKLYVFLGAFIIMSLLCSSLVYAINTDDERSAVVCPRCNAPTTTVTSKDYRAWTKVPCEKVNGKLDTHYAVYLSTRTYCAARCGYSTLDEVFDSIFADCGH